MSTSVQPVAPAKLLYSRREAAAALGLSLQTLDCLIKRGTLPSVKLSRRRSIRARDLEAFAESGIETSIRPNYEALRKHVG